LQGNKCYFHFDWFNKIDEGDVIKSMVMVMYINRWLKNMVGGKAGQSIKDN